MLYWLVWEKEYSTPVKPNKIPFGLDPFILIEVLTWSTIMENDRNIWLRRSHFTGLLSPSEGGGRLGGVGSAADQQEVAALADLPDAGRADVPGGQAGGRQRPSG